MIYNSNLKKIILSVLLILISSLPAISLELDLSVDEEIKKKYDSSKLENTVLPPLPKVNGNSTSPQYNHSKNTVTGVPKTAPIYETKVPTISKADKKNALKIPSGTKFQVRSNQRISDWSGVNSQISFTTTIPTTKRYVTIPSGAIIRGYVVDSHRPQASGNGGLVEITLTNLSYSGKSVAINAKITKANNKNIFFNNIKGKHQYWHGVGQQVNKGERFYLKTRNVSRKLANNPIGIIISPIPAIVGWGSYAVCTVISPVTGFFAKGGNVSIPAGSNFEIKLLDDAYIY